MAARPTLLVVDPLPIFRELETVCLAPLGRILTAGDEDEAFGVLQREPVRLVIASYPPGGPGRISLCERIRGAPSLAHIPLIFVTAGDRPEWHAEAVRTGADDVLTKPLDRVTLLAAVRRLLEQPTVKGLPRVALETPVRIAHEGVETWAVARNLSRGGIYLEAEEAYPPHTEVRLEFPLPGGSRVLASAAGVVWVKLSTGPGPRGMGLRFLGLDGASARSLEHYVHEHRGAYAPQERMEASP